MDHDLATSGRDPLLERAWRQHADFDLAADKRSRRFYTLRKWIAWLGILTVLLAILVQGIFPLPLDTAEPPFRYYAVLGLAVKVLFILTPIVASALAALALRRLAADGSFLVYRAGAEQVKKEIFLYRTVLPKDASRGAYLERRLDEIRTDVEHNLGRKPDAATYKGPLPLSAYKKGSKQIRHGGADPGYHDLSGEDYVTYRLKDQLDWHRDKIAQRGRERLVLTVGVLAAGALGALLAAFGGFLAIWVALTASITAALLGWQELKKTDQVIKNYSRVILELDILYSHWQGLEREERTQAEVERIVLGCENVLWTQNREYVRAMQSALNPADLEKDAALIKKILRETKETARRAGEKVLGNIKEAGRDVLDDTGQRVVYEKFMQDALRPVAEEGSLESILRELEAMVKERGKETDDLLSAPQPESRGLEEAPPSTGSEPAPLPLEDVNFTSIYPKEAQVETWQTLLVYAHVPSALDDLRLDAQRLAGQIPSPKEVTVSASTRLARGAELTIVPSCEGVTFNPERITLKWLEDYQRAEFRFLGDKSLSEDAARGRIHIYAGPLLVGTLPFAMLFGQSAASVALPQEEHGRMYRQEDIFISYSHKDTAVVEACQKAYQALGFNVLIDVDTLRSGQVWNEELMNMIDRASIFQLFWSQNSGESKYCRQEWEHALKKNREGFIRPVYWEQPMPKPPEELREYHFEFMELEGEDKRS